MNLWMVYTCNMKLSGKYGRLEEGKYIYFALLTKVMGDLWLYETILRILEAFSWSWSTTLKMKREYLSSYLSREKEGNCCSKLKKGKLKTKKLLKTTTLGEQDHSVQSADRTKAVQVWPWGNMYWWKPGKWPSQHLYLKINRGFTARKNYKQQYLKVVT